jgi:hypothetical protein
MVVATDLFAPPHKTDLTNNMTAHGTLNDEPIASSYVSSSVVCGDKTAAGLIVAANVMCDRAAGEAVHRESSRLPQLHSAHSMARLSQLHSAHSIRQIDADILEQGVEEKWGAELADFDDEGRRMEPSDSTVSLVDLDDAEAQREFEVCGSDGPSMVESVDESIDLSPSSATSYMAPYPRTGRTCALTASSSCDNLSLPAITEHASCHIPHEVSDGSRSQAHNRSITESFILLNDLSENDDYFLNRISACPSKQEQEIDHAALSLRISSGRGHNRSDSFDRRMNESAQFAEAVGEEPDSLLLQKIVEDDSSSDFDDNEIDEIGVNFVVHEYDPVQLMDYEETISDGQQPGVDATSEEKVGGSTLEKILPTCVSSDVTKMSLNEEDCPHRELPLLPASFEVEIVCPTPNTTAPSPCIPHNVLRHPLTSSTPPYVNWTFTRQYSSALNLEVNNSHSRSLSFPSSEADFVYRGIRSNPPEITKKGVARGNYAQMHRKAWLEVSDKRHRYGKNLRMYYKHWEELGHPFHMFFDWLDSKGEAIGNPLPSLSEIPRPVLDSDTVLYITDPEITASYALDIAANPVDGSATILLNGHPVSTEKEGWIFVLRDNVFYGSQKVTAPTSTAAGSASNGSPSTDAVIPRQRFHHSTFFGGKAVASAGIFLTDKRGLLTQLWPHSGHYRPGEAHMQRVLFFLQQRGVELSTFMVDMQQIFKVTRELHPKGGITALVDKGKGDDDKEKERYSAFEMHTKKAKKMAKVGCLHLLSGQEVALFLAHKALLIEKGVFHQIHKIRRIPKESRDCVRFVLNYVNN